MFHSKPQTVLSRKMVQNFEDYDDEWDACTSCGGRNFEANERDWERVCTSCGRTSAFELFDTINIPIPYYYKHENYFQNTIIANAIGRGAPISSIQEHLMMMFHKSLSLFFRVRHVLKRENYPNYQFALWRLSNHLGVDVRPYINLPKMKKTLEAVEKDWVMIDPTTND